MAQAFRWSVLGVVVITTGCASGGSIAPPQLPAQPGSGTTAVATEQQAPLPLPELPVLQMERQAVPAAPRRLYSLSARDANIRDVLLTFGKSTDIGLALGPDVEGKVTVDLKQATLEEVLDALLSPIGLVFQREGNLVRVSKPQIATRIFTLNYIASTRSGTSSLSASGSTGGGGMSGGQSAGATGGASGAGGGGGGGGAAGGSTTSVSATDSVDLWAELQRTLTLFLSKEGSLVLNKTAGLIAVTDYPANTARVGQYIDLVQGSVQRQVMIEAKIVEVTLSKNFSAGIDWSQVPYALTLPFLGAIKGALPNGAIASQSLATAGSAFQVGLSTQTGFQAILHALDQQGKVSILSSPRVSTMNNQKAVIKVATDDVFFSQTTQREALTGLVTQIVTPNTITEGIVLDVTPQIGEDAITMTIHPSISERLGQVTSPNGDVVPVIAVRATDTVVRVQDGQTVVIGGLMEQRSSRNRSGVPGLQRAPIIGRAFKNADDQETKIELVILLTPTVIVGHRGNQLTPRELELLRQMSPPR
jgi:MSHA type pilus biogenesis protein MshL